MFYFSYKPQNFESDYCDLRTEIWDNNFYLFVAIVWNGFVGFVGLGSKMIAHLFI